MTDLVMKTLQHDIRQTFAVVMAGGRGSRLKQLTDRRAKPAVPFAGKYRFIDFPLSNCVNSGIRRIAVLTQYKAQPLIRHIQHGWRYFYPEFGDLLEVWPAQQQTEDRSWYRGTADAVFQNIEMLGWYQPKFILVLAGDHVYRQDYGRMLAEHIDSGADVSVACVDVPIRAARQFGVVGVDENDEIVRFVEKPANPPSVPGRPRIALGSMGIYLFNASFLFAILHSDSERKSSSHDFGKDIIPDLVGKARLRAHRFASSSIWSHGQKEPYWRDVGTLDAYWAANLDLTAVEPELDLYDRQWPIWTYQALRPPAKFIFDQDNRRGTAIDSLVSAGCIVSGSRIRKSLLFTDVRIDSYSEIENAIILPNARVHRRARLRNVIIDEDCEVPAGLRVGEDPELDASRFERTPSGVTLVTAQMVRSLNFR